MKKQILCVFVIILCAILIGCGGSQNWNQPKPPPPPPPHTVTLESGVKYQDFKHGQGAVVKKGDMITVNYRAQLENEKILSDTFKDGDPIQVTLGTGEVIKGWDEGVTHMRVGGQRKIIVPPDLAYGEEGNPEMNIPPNATLTYYIEVIDIHPMQDLDWGVRYRDIVEGTGKDFEMGDTVIINYIGKLDDGAEFANTYESGETFEFIPLIGEVVQGLDIGFAGMAVGSKRMLYVPTDMAYGPNGNPPLIPPYADLIYYIEIMDIIPTEDLEQGVKYRDVDIGSGAVVSPGDTLSVHYIGALDDALQFDNSYNRGYPFEFTPGVSEVIEGWHVGFQGMAVGGKRILVIPPDMGYGEDGYPPNIPGNAHLLFVAELVEIVED